MRTKCFALFLIGILLGCGKSALAQDKVLNLYSWSEYFPKAVLDQFRGLDSSLLAVVEATDEAAINRIDICDRDPVQF